MNWSSKSIRQTFIDFFIRRRHKFVRSSTVIPKKGQGTYFVNAGMNQFKPIFLGTVSPNTEMSTLKCVVNSQKCIRVGGKHNDLDDVGTDTYHHTFFEMLGSWSFGDYFKRDACHMAWELLTDVYKIPTSRLYVTYFGGNVNYNLQPDNETRDIWLNLGVPESRILPFGSADNFWDMGDTGPCGPCTEIHYDHLARDEAAHLVNQGSPDLVELWNLVFMQYDRQDNGSLKKLPRQHVDTGMGLERLTAVLQGKLSNYDTDLFLPIFRHLEASCEKGSYKGRLGIDDVGGIDTAYRIVADHLRTIAVCISDGLRPGYRDLEYKLYQLMNRCFYQSNHVLEIPPGGGVGDAVPIISEILGDTYPEIKKNQNLIIKIINQLEKAYVKNSSHNRNVFRKVLQHYGNPNKLSALQICEIQNGRFGQSFSYDSISNLCKDHNILLDEDNHKLLRNVHKTESITHNQEIPGSTLDQHDLTELEEMKIAPTDDSSKYSNNLNLSSKAVGIKSQGKLVHHAQKGAEIGLLLSATCFYAESGGQMSDLGTVRTSKGCVIDITDVQHFGDYVLHTGIVLQGDLQVGNEVHLSVKPDSRNGCARNHTATHIINYALEKYAHDVKQCGSKVDSEKLHFDFTCSKNPLTSDDLDSICSECDKLVAENKLVHTFYMPLDQARTLTNIRILDNDDYPQNVRVVSIGADMDDLIENNNTNSGAVTHSVELCGGTHVHKTGDIGHIVITNLVGSGTLGTKRLTAVTGDSATQALRKASKLTGTLEDLRQLVKTNKCSDFWTVKTQEIEKVLGSGSLPKLVRDKVQHELDELRVKILNQQKNLDNKGILTQKLHSLLESQLNEPVIISEFEFDQPRELVEVVGSVMPAKPVMLLKIKGRSVTGVCYVPQDLENFNSHKWTAYLCNNMDGKFRSPKGKNSKFAQCIHVMALNLKDRPLSKALEVAKKYTVDEFQNK